MRRIGIDPGSARTGLAVADDEVPVATPLCTVEQRGIDAAVREVAQIVKREAIGQAVVGLPLGLDGREGEAARRARAFAARLEAAAGIPVVLWDERLSSVAATRALRAQGVRARAGRAYVDQAAASLILQSYLDAQRDRPWEDQTPTTTGHTRPRDEESAG